ncbi:hypothetical protein SCHPADRAFT_909661 [Schizopora paradoxa]|uniref:Uncharacterized protein n=1 Tax=Schizopora paradoxa TaxID=27342 RepID=A0A0H2RR12_9AGAM|nr:hypothetical protein SCHPADRAFT_909661 [Schizopora paradoxa]
MALIDTRKLTHLSLCFFGANPPGADGSAFENLVGTIFPLWLPGFSVPPTYAMLAKFSMKMGCFRGSPHLFQRIFTSMPNVQDISLDLPYDSDICLSTAAS